VEDALRSYTINNAYAAFWEKTTGSIVAGKHADFVVHSTNLLTATPKQILESKVIRTVVGGKDYLFDSLDIVSRVESFPNLPILPQTKNPTNVGLGIVM
jgi:predicted amidohydrolase YtcJ